MAVISVAAAPGALQLSSKQALSLSWPLMVTQ